MFRTALVGAIDEVKSNVATNLILAKPKTNETQSARGMNSATNQRPTSK